MKIKPIIVVEIIPDNKPAAKMRDFVSIFYS
jgi:hypothetical protein